MSKVTNTKRTNNQLEELTVPATTQTARASTSPFSAKCALAKCGQVRARVVQAGHSISAACNVHSHCYRSNLIFWQCLKTSSQFPDCICWLRCVCIMISLIRMQQQSPRAFYKIVYIFHIFEHLFNTHFLSMQTLQIEDQNIK